MVPNLRAFGNTTVASRAGTIGLIVPASVQDEDVLVIGIEVDGPPALISAPAGWTLIEDNYTNGFGSAGFTKRMTAAEAGTTINFTWSGTQFSQAAWVVYDGAVATGSFLSGTPSQSGFFSGSTGTLPSITTADAKALYVGMMINIDVGATHASANGLAEDHDVSCVAFYSIGVVTPGFYAGGNVTTTGGVVGWDSYALGIAPAAPVARTDVRFAAPDDASGAQPPSTAAAWTPGAWKDLLPYGWDYDIALVDLVFQVTGVLALDTTREVLFEIATGAVGSETVVAQVPYSYRNDTAVGYYLDNDDRVTFPEPIKVNKDTRVAVRVTDSAAAALTYQGVKIRFMELATSGTTPISSSDVNGTVTETATVTVSLSSADASALTTDALLTLVASLSSSDINGTVTETQKVGLASSDANGATTETQALVAAISNTEAGAIAETATPAVVLSSSDINGTVTETSAPKAALSSSDVGGASSETGAVAVPIAGSDVNGTVSETSALTAALSGSDVNGAVVETAALHLNSSDVNGATTETATLAAQLSGSDSGTVAESAGIGNNPKFDSDSGSVSETAGLVAQVTGTDANATTVETAALVARPQATDVNGSTVEASVLLAKPLGADAGSTSAEDSTLVGRPTSADTGTSSETATPSTTKSSFDTNGTTTESGSVATQVSSSDIGGDLETATISHIGVTYSDSGTMIETQTVALFKFSSDSGTITEAASVRFGITFPAIPGGGATEISLTGSFATPMTGRTTLDQSSGEVEPTQTGRVL